MSKSSDTVVQGDVDESILFDDGYSIVDDINTGTGAMGESKGGKSFTKENDTKVKNEEATEKKEEAKGVIEKEKENGSKKHDAIKTENVEREIIKKEKLIGLESSVTKNSDVSESTLIISNDDDLGTDMSALDNSLGKLGKHTNELNKEKSGKIVPTNTNKCVDTSVVKTTQKKKLTDGNFVWISNISKLVKASSLKKHFAECGKVNTAKVVTNGKVFFGYVEFESSEHALTCVKTLNNSILGGKNIIVSRNRPDVNKKTVSAKKNLVNNAIINPKPEEIKNEFVGTEQPGKASASEAKHLTMIRESLRTIQKMRTERE
ncbi:hypothetical protein WA026_010732 [Henosepilachna vigintioctopunctata]|uniref:RRM domain-containing protein n=1 Tax=Henosepilachna vigintioctopunctata TaxID=420089 RepID=A0AAW1UPX0_9CUCU